MSNGTPTDEDFLTTAQVADLTRWSITSINRKAASGEIPARKLPGRTGPWLFRREDIDAVIERRTSTAA